MEWHSVDEKPTHSGDVLLHEEGWPYTYIGFWSACQERWGVWLGEDIQSADSIGFHPTHWMPYTLPNGQPA